MLSVSKLATLSVVLAATVLLGGQDLYRAHAGDSPATVSIGSGVVAPGSDITLDVTVASSAETVVSAGINITYDSKLVDATGCTVTQGVALCNLAYGENTLRMIMADAFDGLNGVVGSVTFRAIGPSGTTANLHVVVTACGGAQGDPLECATHDGTIAITDHTASPSPTSVPTPVATATPVPQPTVTPSPSMPTVSTPTPAPTSTPRLWGDINCDGHINSVDTLILMRWIAALPVLQVPPCPAIGSLYP